jgi:hypothetical protein
MKAHINDQMRKVEDTIGTQNEAGAKPAKNRNSACDINKGSWNGARVMDAEMKARRRNTM